MRSAQRVQWAQFRVAAVSGAAIVILSTLLYLLTGATLFSERANLYLYIPDATGLGPDSPVRVDGITVGKVVSVGLSGSSDPHRVVRVKVSVLRRSLTFIPPDSWAQLSVDSPVGDKFVDITGVGTGVRRPGTEIIYREQPDLFKSFDLEQFEIQLRQIDALLTDIETGRSRVGQFVIGTEMYSDFRKRFTQLDREIRRAASTTSAVGQELYTDRLYQRMLAPLVELDAALARLQSQQFLRDSAQYEQVRAAITDLGNTVAGLRAGEWFQSDQLYNDWNRGLASLIQTVAQVNATPMLATSQAYESLNGWAAELRDSLRDFRQDPRKYLRLKMF